MAMAARMPMIATTIISSIRVKPFWTFFIRELLWVLDLDVRHAFDVCGVTYASGVPSPVFLPAEPGRGFPCDPPGFTFAVMDLDGGAATRCRSAAAPWASCEPSHRKRPGTSAWLRQM